MIVRVSSQQGESQVLSPPKEVQDKRPLDIKEANPKEEFLFVRASWKFQKALWQPEEIQHYTNWSSDEENNIRRGRMSCP